MFPKRSQSVSGPSSSGITTMEGVLEKKKTFGSSRFHCALREGQFWYSEDKGRENVIDISHAQSIREGKAKFSFEIITRSRTHVFIADSQNSREKWISCLREAMRIFSRKMSAHAYIEADEDSMSISSRSSSSLTVKPALTSLNPGITSTLPASLVTSTSRKYSEKGEIPDLREPPTRVSDAAFMSQSGDGIRDESKPKCVTAETDAESIERRRDEKNSIEITEDLESGIKGKPESLNDGDGHGTKSESFNVGDYELVMRSSGAFQVKEFGVISEDDGEDDQHKNHPMLNEDGEKERELPQLMPVEIVTLAPSSLYANSADYEKFISEQRVDADGSRPRSTETHGSVKSDDLSRSGPLTVNSSEVESMTDILESTEPQNSEDADENSDEVFPLIGDGRKVVEPCAGPVVRRRSQSRSSTGDSFDVVSPEPVELELDVDFISTPIPDLPHPRLGSNWSASFVDIRSMLSDNVKDDSFSSSVQPDGLSVETLKCFLNSLECI